MPVKLTKGYPWVILLLIQRQCLLIEGDGVTPVCLKDRSGIFIGQLAEILGVWVVLTDLEEGGFLIDMLVFWERSVK